MMISELPEQTALNNSDLFILQSSISGDYAKFPVTTLTVPFQCLFPSSVTVLYMSTIISRVQATVEQLSADRCLVTFNVPGTLSFSTESATPVELVLTSDKFSQTSDAFCVSVSSSSATGINGALKANFNDGIISLMYSLYDPSNHTYLESPVSISNGNPFTLTDFKAVFYFSQSIRDFI